MSWCTEISLTCRADILLYFNLTIFTTTLINMDSDTAAQLKSSVYLTVAKMVEQQVESLEGSVSVTPSFVALLVELVYNQLINLGEDLELFANHASRTTIKPADLFMVTRKNELLTAALKQLEQSWKSQTQ